MRSLSMKSCWWVKPAGRKWRVEPFERWFVVFRSGDEYRESIRDGHKVYVNDEQIDELTPDPIFKPIVDRRPRIYDIAHQESTWRW